MSQTPPDDPADPQPSSAVFSSAVFSGAVIVTIACVLGLLISWYAVAQSPSTLTELAFAFFEISLVSIVIWQACDPFADAAQFLGEKWRIPSSVRGATLDAVASSLPELFTGLFFVMLTITSADGESTAKIANRGADGFGATIATCAGSAVYNMILIPAFCGITIGLSRKRNPVIKIDRKVILRDGLWFFVCECVLVAMLFQKKLAWPVAAILIALYAIYIVWLVIDAKRYRRARVIALDKLRLINDPDDQQIRDALEAGGIHPPLNLIVYVRRELNGQSSDPDDGDSDDTAGLLFGWLDIPLSSTSAYSIIAISTLITAFACYWLVEVTMQIAETLAVPVFFVAVIVAAAASSVPDTLLSVGAAKRGDDDGAVSNAFGSNIFDICICLSVPLIAALYLSGGEPIDLSVDGNPMPGLLGLQILLLTLTAITLGTLAHRLELNLRKSCCLVLLYLVFIGYAVAGSMAW